MGQSPRPRPARLAKKLFTIRERLGLSQNELIERFGLSGEIDQARISAYERNDREPLLSHLLQYARLGLGNGAYLENLIDDEMELPANNASRGDRRSRTRGPVKRQCSK